MNFRIQRVMNFWVDTVVAGLQEKSFKEMIVISELGRFTGRLEFESYGFEKSESVVSVVTAEKLQLLKTNFWAETREILFSLAF